MALTHVSYDGYLQRIRGVVDHAPAGAQFVSFGRLVSPNGDYRDAPRVQLYRIPGDGFIAVRMP